MFPEELSAHPVSLPSPVGKGSVVRKLRASLKSLLKKGSGSEGLEAKLLRIKSCLLKPLNGGKVLAESSLSIPPLLMSLKGCRLANLIGLQKSLSNRLYQIIAHAPISVPKASDTTAHLLPGEDGVGDPARTSGKSRSC